MNGLRTVAVTVALVAIAVGSTPTHAQETGSTEHDVAVDGRTLHLACTGSGTPTVLFEAGGPDAAGGAIVVAQVGADVSAALGARFCAYDRAGTGRSPEDPIGVRTFREAAADLNALLASEELECPCVVIGESLGGSIALVALDGRPVALRRAGPPRCSLPRLHRQRDSSWRHPTPRVRGWPLARTPNGWTSSRASDRSRRRQSRSPSRSPSSPTERATRRWLASRARRATPWRSWRPPGRRGRRPWPRRSALSSWSPRDTGHSIAGENPGLVVQLVSEVIATVRDADAPASVDESPSA